ncbi:MFS transporter [Paenibacillus sp. CN-4]|uniref:MFS transporter n=1 Tax=Paenibacillus nanchangensis TaxID=3348343 RepID=UPI003979E446
MLSRLLNLKKEYGAYPKLFAAGLVNGIGDRFSQVAMLSLVLQLTGSGMAVGIALGVRVLPYLLLAPVGGLLGQKVSRKKILVFTDLLRAPVALSLLWADGPDRLWVVYAASFLLAAGEAVYSPVRKSAIPLLVPAGRLLSVNGLEQLMTGCVLVVGAFAGGIISMHLGPDWAFVWNAASFTAAAGIIGRISFVRSGADADEGRPGGELAGHAGDLAAEDKKLALRGQVLTAEDQASRHQKAEGGPAPAAEFPADRAEEGAVPVVGFPTDRAEEGAVPVVGFPADRLGKGADLERTSRSAGRIVRRRVKAGRRKPSKQSAGQGRTLLALFAASVPLQVIFAYELLVPMINGLDNVLISVYAVQVFQLGDAGVGAFYGAIGLGLSLSFAAEKLIRGRLLAGMLGGLLAEGLLLALLSFSGNFAVAFLCYFLLAFAGGIGGACLDTLLMQETPKPFQPVLFGFLTAMGNTLLGLSMFGAGLLLEAVEPRQAGFAGGIAFAVVAVVLGIFYRVRSRSAAGLKDLSKTAER